MKFTSHIVYDSIDNSVYLSQNKFIIMFKGMLHLHLTSVIVFLLIYLVKTILLTTNSKEKLEVFKAKTKVLEMIASTAFLVSGIYMLFNIPEIKTMLIIKIVMVVASIPLAVVAYKKENKALAILSFLMIVMAYGLAEMSRKHSKNEASSKMSNEKFSETFGRDLYIIECQKCHGDDGKLGVSGAFDLSASALSKEEAIVVIKNGRGFMKGVKDVYNDQQIDAVAEYIQSLKK